MIFFRHHIKRKIEDERIDLLFDCSDLSSSGHYRSYCFMIMKHGTRTKIGECDIRIGKDDNEELYYAGNAGYRIYEKWRGHGYAYDACRIMIRIMKKDFGIQHMWLTCSPENIASRKTIEKLGGHFIEETNVPSWHWLYKRGEKVKQIYSINL